MSDFYQFGLLNAVKYTNPDQSNIFTSRPPERGNIVSREPAVGEHNRGSEGEKTLERFVQHLLQHHHLVVLLLPHLVEMKEDDKTVL